MAINFMTINYKDKAYVLHLAPESILEELQLQGQFALAIGISSDDEPDKNEIIGLTTFYVDTKPIKESFLSIRWFYILPEYRRKGYGRALLNKLCDIAIDNKMAEIRMIFPEIEDTANFDALFYEMDFAYRVGNIVEVYTNLGEISAQETIKGKLIADSNAVPLSKVAPHVFKAYYNELPAERKHLAEYLLPSSPESYDKDVSHVILDQNGRISAAFLLRYVNEALEPVLFLSNSKEKSIDLLKLLSKALIAGADKHGREVSVRLRSTDLTKWDTYENLFKNFAYRPSIIGVMRF